MNKVREAAEAWQADAIEQCRADPEEAAREARGEWCIGCEMPHPCICDKTNIKGRMRTFYEANRRTLTRSEPKLIGSWGIDRDGLMTGLLEIAEEPYMTEIRRLRKLLDSK